MSTAIAAEPLVVGPDDNGIQMTTDEFDAIEEYDDDYRYELINGVFVVNPIPSQGERDPNEELGFLLRMYRDEHPGFLDKTLFEEYIRLPNSRRRADRVIWAGLGRVWDGFPMSRPTYRRLPSSLSQEAAVIDTVTMF